MTYYTTGKVLGSGTYSTVYISHDENARKYAKKVFDKNEDDRSLSPGTIRELSIISLINNLHSNIICSHAFLCEENLLNMVMDIHPMTLGDAITMDILTYPEKIKIAFGLIDAVGFLHHNMIVHRDIKPGNILLSDSTEPILCDFSLSKIFDDAGLQGISHTPDTGCQIYASPEIIFGKCYSHVSDLYSLGVVLYEMFTGKLLKSRLKKEMPKISIRDKSILSMLRGFLSNDPNTRMLADTALDLPVFTHLNRNTRVSIRMPIKDKTYIINSYISKTGTTKHFATYMYHKMMSVEFYSYDYEDIKDILKEELRILKILNYNMYVMDR
jgi:serine/threonine protein kinase